MCGRVLVGEQKDIVITGRDGRQFKPKPNGTGNPGSMLPVVTDAMPDKVQQFRWGLLTPEDDKIHDKYKHARIENLHNRKTWKDLLGRKHCVIRIQAFFEYNKEQEKLYRVERVDGKPFYIAGLWDIWMDIPTTLLIPTFAMITMPPNRAMAEIHDRMPAILERGDIKTWLDKGLTGTERAAFLQSRPCLPETLKITVEQARS
ncbi:SOS response-associated peptidase [Mucilaginibacter myungsuensis]|uniref:Abasic site processing protein n=1 Tax=Mucilaginibacter myungsuensis TaxID=649104 RepID=A0A929L2Z0_9SPHI|nr:SOS response-associated peptidase [Mucilaginibacter myungsuensis]MBE9663120.1 SOS response-associated peptidase [Mucilaginibacter myungsuensis]MDN3598755.1 SOS response-associated peptidase [Mucilaginibacter myungsuensis]